MASARYAIVAAFVQCCRLQDQAKEAASSCKRLQVLSCKFWSVSHTAWGRVLMPFRYIVGGCMSMPSIMRARSKVWHLFELTLNRSSKRSSIKSACWNQVRHKRVSIEYVNYPSSTGRPAVPIRFLQFPHSTKPKRLPGDQVHCLWPMRRCGAQMRGSRHWSRRPALGVLQGRPE